MKTKRERKSTALLWNVTCQFLTSRVSLSRWMQTPSYTQEQNCQTWLTIKCYDSVVGIEMLAASRQILRKFCKFVFIFRNFNTDEFVMCELDKTNRSVAVRAQFDKCDTF